jgi:transcriptional regulator with XRE-family HTH domain
MNALRTWRQESRKSLEETAPLLGVSPASLSRIERGEQWPDRDFCERLQAITGGRVTANDLIPTAPRAGAHTHARAE